MATTKVSVIIPAYNQGHYLAGAIQSVLDQTYLDFEILVVDDGSTDNTAAVTKGFQDSRVHYLYQENRGLSGARNTGYLNSVGAYITYLDSDDLFKPTKLARQISFLENYPAYGCVAGRTEIIDEYDTPTGTTFDRRPPETPENFLLGNPLSVHSVMIRRIWQDKAGLFDESLRSYEDWDMWLRLARLGCKFGWVDETVAYYRFHTAQMTRIGSQMTQATFAVLDKTFSDPNLPVSWLQLKDQAYSAANLRAMAQAYLAEDFDQAKAFMAQAIKLDPLLVAEGAETLAKRLSALSESPKNSCRLSFLERIYANLPVEADALRNRAPQELSRVAYESALSAYQRLEYQKARTYLGKAIQYRPSLLAKPGVIPTILKSYLHS